MDDQASAASVGQRFAEDYMDLEDGLRIQSTLAVSSTGGEQFSVERLQLLGPKPAHRDGPEARHHMKLDQPSITVPGTWPEIDLLGREPLT